MDQMKKTERKLLSSQIEEELMEYIQSQPLEIGDKVPNEFELAERFGVSRSTIREAVKGLASKGVLEVRRGSGTFVVNTIPVEDDPLGLRKLEDEYKLALELLEVRLMIEPDIAALAAEYASPEECRVLKEYCDEVEELCLAGKNHILKDVEFHTWIAKCSKNRVVENLIPIINTAVMTFANLTNRSLRTETIKTHRAVTDAILSHDAVGARCAMIMHLTYNRQALIALSKRENNKERAETSDV